MRVVCFFLVQVSDQVNPKDGSGEKLASKTRSTLLTDN